MSLFSSPLPDGTSRYPGPSVMYIDGVPSTNSAAKFWPCLVDEALGEFPSCTHIALCATSDTPLRFDDLFPAWSLQRDMEKLSGVDIRQAMADTIAALELVGGPGPVTLSLSRADAVLLQQPLPPECIDTETFPCLLVWLLEWSGLHHSMWNDEQVTGDVDMLSPERQLRYSLDFELNNEPLSEGLFRRTLILRPTRAIVPL